MPSKVPPAKKVASNKPVAKKAAAKKVAKKPAPSAAYEGHPALLAFLNGAHARLRAAFIASAEMSRESSGTVREFGLRSALEYTLLSSRALYSGDIIDADRRRTGQLDFIVAHASTPALGSREDEPRIVFAEGVLGVIELKSNLAKH